MSFDITGLQSWVALHSKQIATKAVTTATTAKLLIDNNAVQYGIKGSVGVLKMDTSASLQAFAGCAVRTGSGTISLSNKQINVTKITDFTTLNKAVLDNTYYQVFVAQGANPETPIMDIFSAKIVDLKTQYIALANEQLLWQGNTSLTGATSLNLIDGIVKQVTGSSVGYISLSAATSGATIVEQLQNAFYAMPVSISSQPDFRIFIGQDLFNAYTIALGNKNIFKPTEDMTLYSTSAILQPTSGLNGTKQLFAGRISAFQLGLDGLDDTDKAELNYSLETKCWYLDYNYALGVSVVFPEQVGYVQLS